MISITSPFVEELDHIGIAVNDLDAAIALYKTRFGLEVATRETLEKAKVELAFLETPGTRIEFVAPTATSGTLYDFLQKRGPGLHHIAYRVRDIRAALEELAAQGCTLLDREPRPGAHGTEIAFVHPRDFDGVLTELVQRLP